MVGFHRYEALEPASDRQPWVPTHNRDQSCAFCGAARPTFVHRLDPAHAEFRLYGQGYMLPTFWAACLRCETWVQAGDEQALLGLDDGVRDEETLAAFRAADLGPEVLAGDPPANGTR